MPEMTPVGNQFVPPDPQAGLNRLSSIINLKQQQQDLQTGAIQQATSQAESKLAQQKASQMQAAQQLAITGGKSGKYTLPNGSFDNLGFANDLATVAPNIPELRTQYVSMANEVVQNQRAHQQLTMERKKEIGAVFASLAADPEVDNTKIIDSIEALRQAHPNDPEFSRLLTSMVSHMPNTAKSQDLQNMLGAWSAAATGESQAEPASMETSTEMIPGQRNKFTGAFTQAGQRVSKNIGVPGVMANDRERANQVSAGIQPATSAIRLSTEIDDLADQVNQGKFSKFVSETAAATGLNPMATARQLLAKDLGQLKTLAGASAGSDARLQTILSGYPEETSNTQTIHTAMDYLRGNFRQQLARGENLNKYRTVHPDLSGFQHADDVLTSQTDPLMHEYLALQPGKARVEFFKRNFSNKDEAKAFRDKAEGVSHVLGK